MEEYETEEELEILMRMGKLITLRQNLFMPQMKLIHRHRASGKIYEIDIPLK